MKEKEYRKWGKMEEKKSVEKRISKIRKNWKREIKNVRQRKKSKRRIKVRKRNECQNGKWTGEKNEWIILR